jgi:uncharacterized protein YqeY
MKNRSPEKDILRVFLAKLQQIEADEGTAKVNDDRCASVAKSVIKGNNDAIAVVNKQFALVQVRRWDDSFEMTIDGSQTLNREAALKELAAEEITPLGKKLIEITLREHPLPNDLAVTEAKLKAENAIMESFLPTYLTPEQVTVALSENAETLEKIKKANNDGAATGVAMKYLKGQNLQVEGNIVKDVVKAIWTEARTGGQ